MINGAEFAMTESLAEFLREFRKRYARISLGKHTEICTEECRESCAKEHIEAYTKGPDYGDGGSERWLWVDQICINQNDPLEKAAQVSNTLTIYDKAEEVVAWLGPSSEEIDLAIHCSEDHDFSRKHGGLDDTVVQGYIYLSARSWFRRVWVQQEVWAARDLRVWCGSRSIEWSALCSRVTIVRSRKTPLSFASLEPWKRTKRNPMTATKSDVRRCCSDCKLDEDSRALISATGSTPCWA